MLFLIQGKPAGADKREKKIFMFPTAWLELQKWKSKSEQFVAMAEFNQNEQSKVVLNGKIQRYTHSFLATLVQGRRQLAF